METEKVVLATDNGETFLNDNVELEKVNGGCSNFELFKCLSRMNGG